MKIEGPNKADSASSAKKSKASDGADGAFKTMLADSPAQAAPSSAARTIASIDVLLAVQGVEDPTEKAARKRMQQRGHNLLDMLENMRMALLSGRMSVGHMLSLADTIAGHREKITDPELMGILDEIDLRAQIELAKMTRAYEQSQKNKA